MLHFPNGPGALVAEMLGGMAACYPKIYRYFNANVILNAAASPDRVAVITSGGAAAEPQFAGFVGPGLADAACVGNLRAAPNAYALYEAGKFLGKERGVLFIYNNFAGDLLNNDMAAELLELDGIAAKSVLACDDIASARGEPRSERGGLTGVLFLIKIAAEASRRGLGLTECHRLAEKANARLGSVTLVEDAAAGDIMIGSGFSGEPPLARTGERGAAALADKLLGMLLEDIRPEASDRIEVMINRLSGSTYMESFAFAKVIREALAASGHSLGRVHVGNYFNPVRARGYYLCLFGADGELCGYLDGMVHNDSFSI